MPCTTFKHWERTVLVISCSVTQSAFPAPDFLEIRGKEFLWEEMTASLGTSDGWGWGADNLSVALELVRRWRVSC